MDTNRQNIQEEEVTLHVYDLTQGTARSLSSMFLGKQIDAIWHTGIVVFGLEVYFGSDGIKQCQKGATILGNPLRVIKLGKTQVSKSLFQEYIATLSSTSYRGSSYDLFYHNCNNFSEEVSQFLTSKSIPKEILDLPKEVLQTPMGQHIRTLMGISGQSNFFNGTANRDIPTFDNFLTRDPTTAACKNVTNNAEENNVIVFNSQNFTDGILKLKEVASQHCSVLNDLYFRYSMERPTFSQAKAHHYEALMKIMNCSNNETICLLLQMLQYLCLKDDYIDILEFDNKDNYLFYFFERLPTYPTEIQIEACKLLCNIASKPEGINWMMDISSNVASPVMNQPVIVQNLTSWILGTDENLQGLAVRTLYNISLQCSKITKMEDLALECVPAALQLLEVTKDEPINFLILSLLLNFVHVKDIPALIQALSPDFRSIEELSSRLKSAVNSLTAKLQSSQ